MPCRYYSRNLTRRACQRVKISSPVDGGDAEVEVNTAAPRARPRRQDRRRVECLSAGAGRRGIPEPISSVVRARISASRTVSGLPPSRLTEDTIVRVPEKPEYNASELCLGHLTESDS